MLDKYFLQFPQRKVELNTNQTRSLFEQTIIWLISKEIKDMKRAQVERFQYLLNDNNAIRQIIGVEYNQQKIYVLIKDRFVDSIIPTFFENSDESTYESVKKCFNRKPHFDIGILNYNKIRVYII